MVLKDKRYAQGGLFAEQEFYRILIGSGYPQQVLRPESGPTAHNHDVGVDFFVLAPGLSTEPIVAFEVKSFMPSPLFLRRLLPNAENLCREYPGCAYYLVALSPRSLAVKRYDAHKRAFVSCERIPTYDELTANWLRRVAYVGGVRLRDVTVFKSLRLDFARGLNVLIGENGFGKSTLLKILYSQAKWASESERRDRVSRSGEDAYIESVFGLPAFSLVTRNGKDDFASIETTFGGEFCGVTSVLLTKKMLVDMQTALKARLHKLKSIVHVRVMNIKDTKPSQRPWTVKRICEKRGVR